jgi:hypothetical protein
MMAIFTPTSDWQDVPEGAVLPLAANPDPASNKPDGNK